MPLWCRGFFLFFRVVSGDYGKPFQGVQNLFEKNPQKGLEFKSWQARLGRRERPPPQTRHWSGPVFPGFTGDFSNGEKAPGMKCWVWSFLLNHCGTCQREGFWRLGLRGCWIPNLWCFSDDIESNLWSIRYLYRPRLWSIGGHMLVYYFCHSKCRFI